MKLLVIDSELSKVSNGIVDGNYYKENSVTGKTGLVCIHFSYSYSD